MTELKPCPLQQTEIWVPVIGYDHRYAVSNYGRVAGEKGLLKPYDNGYGYLIVEFRRDGKRKHLRVHRLVAEAFIPNPDNLPMVNHKDEDKTNNFLENLEWCTASYNRTYGKAIEKHARKLRGKTHTEEHKQKISESLRRRYGERRTDNG